MKIIRPSRMEVKYYLKLWDSPENEKYILQERSLKKLFLKTYPSNNNLDDVLIKVCSLSIFYNIRIFSPFTVAKHIVALKIDSHLLKNDLEIVNKIAYIKMNGGRNINFYSFATKYCSHHKPTVYPIYDSFVEKMLMYWKKDKFYNFSKNDLKSYALYKNIIINFRKHYGLRSFDFKQIDKYLWQSGKKYFPKKY